MSTFDSPAANPNPNRSTEVAQPPTDSISSLAFSPKANFLVATSWDNQEVKIKGESIDRCWNKIFDFESIPNNPKTSLMIPGPLDARALEQYIEHGLTTDPMAALNHDFETMCGNLLSSYGRAYGVIQVHGTILNNMELTGDK